MRMEAAAQLLLMAVVVPLWIAAGLADWWCHRRTRIESSSGLPENVFHWILFGEAGVLMLATALLEVNAGVLMLVFAAFLAHEATTFMELAYTVPRREVRPFEQMVHSFMELLPLVVLALLAASQWDQALALFGAGAPDFSLQPKLEPWPPPYLLGAATAAGLFNVLPLAEEALRCLSRK